MCQFSQNLVIANMWAVYCQKMLNSSKLSMFMTAILHFAQNLVCESGLPLV